MKIVAFYSAGDWVITVLLVTLLFPQPRDRVYNITYTMGVPPRAQLSTHQSSLRMLVCSFGRSLSSFCKRLCNNYNFTKKLVLEKSQYSIDVLSKFNIRVITTCCTHASGETDFPRFCFAPVGAQPFTIDKYSRIISGFLSRSYDKMDDITMARYILYLTIFFVGKWLVFHFYRVRNVNLILLLNNYEQYVQRRVFANVSKANR